MTLATWFEDVAGALTDKDQIKSASNFIVSDILGLLKKMQHFSFQKQLHFQL